MTPYVYITLLRTDFTRSKPKTMTERMFIVIAYTAGTVVGYIICLLVHPTFKKANKS